MSSPESGLGWAEIYHRFPPVHEFHGLRLVSPPVAEPVSLVDAKMHCRIDIADEDPNITAYLLTAREYVEHSTKLVLRPQVWRLSLMAWPRVNYIQIPLGPVRSVLSVKYTDSSGTVWTMTPNVDYFVDLEGPQARIVLPFAHVWPPVVMNTASPIQITYSAGYLATKSTVNVSGSTVSWVSGDVFDPLMGYGVATLGSTPCVVSSVASTTSLSLLTAPGDANAAQFTYDELPNTFRQAILFMVGHFYENRSAVVVGRVSTIATEIMLTVDALLSTKEIHRF